MSVVRTSYWSTKEKKNKYLQVGIAKYGSREAAKEFLEKKKKLMMERENGTDEKKEDPKEEPKEDTKEESKEDNTETNLMDMETEASPHLDQIISSIKYSPFRLEIDETTGTSITIFGSSKSYKTTLLKRIIDKYYSKDCMPLLCAQNIHAPIYDDLNNNVITINHYSPNLVKSMAKINKKTKNKYRFLVILDDIIDSKNDKQLEQLYLTLRNAQISVICNLQNIQLLKATSRGNSNIVVFRRFNQDKAIEKYCMQEYLANFPPFKDLKMADKILLYRKITNKHDYFVLDIINNTLILCKKDPSEKIY